MAFATTGDMESRSGGQITATTHPFLERELAAATRAIQTACGWHIAPVEEVVYKRAWSHPRMVFLPASRIGDVKRVSVDGTPRDTNTLIVDPLTGETNLVARYVDVTFEAGFETTPEDLMLLTLELAAAGLGTSLGITREQAGGVALTYGRTGAISAADEPRLVAYSLGYVP